MHFKRELSTASDLYVNNVSESIKRLAISRDGHPEKAMNLRDPSTMEQDGAAISTVMSSAQDDFSTKYDLIREIGKGGFSTVYQCKDRRTGADYAVKVVDLRPLRLRERFNPVRLRREVDIMKRLHHPNIIQFVDVFEDADHLMMIMEYCPGKELFDVILERRHFQEDDARPIFAQIARALYYLHSLNILHRDVKPENVLISAIPDQKTGGLVAKLLDFGLSKNAGNGSAAKTFVGTPCYVAPEVEYTSKGLGGTYSFPADCWSLGAVLYVMLVARFPEFEQDQTGKVVVKLSPALWSNVSNEAKDLIRSLMNTNPAARLSMGSCLMHPWLGKYRATQDELSRISVASYDLNQVLQEEEARMEALERAKVKASAPSNAKLNDIGEVEDVEMTAGGVVVHQQAMVVRNINGPEAAGAHGNNEQQLHLAPLLHLQRSIATCFEEVHASYKDLPEVASEVRQGAALCREQLTESTKMLRKVEQTAAAVLGMFPDLELAVEEGEPQLAAEFFGMVKGWVVELREMVNSTQGINKASMFQIQQIVERSTIGLMNRQKQKQQQTISVPKKLLDTVVVKLGLGDRCMIENGCAALGADQDNNDSNATVELDANNILELFMSLFGGSGGNGKQQLGGASSPRGTVPNSSEFGRVYSIDSDSNSLESSPDHRHDISHSAGNVHTGNTATSKALFRLPSNNSGRSAISLPSDDATLSVHGKRSNSEQEVRDARVTGISTPDFFSQSVEDRRDRGDTITSAMDMEESEDRKDSYDSTISLDTFQPRQAFGDNNGGNIPLPQPAQRGQTGPQPLMIENVLGGDADSSVPPSPGQGAAAHLAEALNKLRQVDEILEQLSVFWANTEVVLDLLTKKGQHVEQFIGFASKPKLMARFRERMEEYKRFWENVSIMCSNYIAGVQTTNDTQRMYGFLETESLSSLSTNSTPKGPSVPPSSNIGGSGNSVFSRPPVNSSNIGMGLGGYNTFSSPIR